MKYIVIITLLILTNCKIETKTESRIDKLPIEMWNDYVKANPSFSTEKMPNVDYFHNNKEDASRLGELVVQRKKKAASSLYSLYEIYKVDLPKVGRKQIITDFEGNALTIIATTAVDTIPFNKISAAYAELDMGTNNEPLKKWKIAHWTFFESFLKESGQKPTENMLIVCEKFESIWPKND